MDREFSKILLTELNMVSYEAGNSEDLTDSNMVKALTVNENLTSLGYTLRPTDIVSLACSKTCECLYRDIKEMLPDVKAEPMYPDFPSQVMSISEAEFRFHQALHYFSTYGIEFLTGQKVGKGWLPSVERTEKTEKDSRLLDLKVLELVREEDVCKTALRIILGKKERMTIPETMIVMKAVKEVNPEDIKDLRITFKENTTILFDEALKMSNEEKLIVMRIICQHTGDVLKNILRVLQQNKYHLHTSQKKAFVKLLESYPAGDFRNNLMRSKLGREKNIMILQKLDYNYYSRSEEHLSAVNDLRNDKIKSWEGIAKNMLENHLDGSLDFVAKRPGTMLRMAGWILTLGYSEEEVTEKLCINAEKLSVQTIVGLLTKFSNMTRERIQEDSLNEQKRIKQKYYCEYEEISPDRIISNKRWSILRIKNTCSARYNAAIDRLKSERDRQLRAWDTEALNSQEKDQISYLRNDYLDEMIEINRAYDPKRERIRNKIKDLNVKSCNLRRRDKEREVIRESMRKYYISLGKTLEEAELYTNGFGRDKKLEVIKSQLKALNDELSGINRELEERINAVVLRMEENTKSKCDEIHSEFEEKRRIAEEMIEKITLEYEEKRSKINKADFDKDMVAEIKKIEAYYDLKLENADKDRAEIKKREAADLKTVIAKEEQGYKRLESVAVLRRILSKVLQEHMRRVETGLKDKKVFFDMDEFDLEHSQILANMKSQEGGYIPSGIAYRIPEDSKIVRFFVYWNDENRVDIDLHANGISTSGDIIHVGWNSDFRKCGVLHSGDITHSDAAEYIDVDISQPIQRIYTNVHLFSGKYALCDVDECYVGMMAVDKAGKEVKLYDRANCFFSHEIKMNCEGIFYGYIDVENRFVRFVGRPDEIGTPKWKEDGREDIFTLDNYLNILMESQNACVVDNKEEADVILSMGKSIYENGLSLIDENFFMDAV